MQWGRENSPDENGTSNYLSKTGPSASDWLTKHWGELVTPLPWAAPSVTWSLTLNSNAHQPIWSHVTFPILKELLQQQPYYGTTSYLVLSFPGAKAMIELSHCYSNLVSALSYSVSRLNRHVFQLIWAFGPPLLIEKLCVFCDVNARPRSDIYWLCSSN